MKFELTILGSGAAVPAHGRFSASQILTTHNKSFMIDCADGTQHQLINLGLKHNKLNHILISHLHGDHCFGIIALISTLAMKGRVHDMYIHSHPDLQALLQPQIDYFCKGMSFKVIFKPFNPLVNKVIYQDRSLTIETIPLVHSMQTCGFLFKEKQGKPHLNKEMLEFYKVGVKDTALIAKGGDFTSVDGLVIKNERFLLPPSTPNSYAYCSDTAYSERIIPIIKGVNCLYHEATFASDHEYRAKLTLHSTPAQAATIAQKAGANQLIIGHYSARYKTVDHLLTEAKAVFNNTLLSYDGMNLKF